jgi:lipopolysaccharide biosynthesis glycosyltransferase
MNISLPALNDLKAKRYWFLDQDVLNKYLVGHVKFLDTSWNCVNMSMDVLGGLNVEWAAKAREDFNAPKIIHYAGFEAKPWNNPSAPWSEVYWYYLRRTYWFEVVALQFPAASGNGHLIHKGLGYRLIRLIWRNSPNFVKVTLGGAMHNFNNWYFKLQSKT